MDKNVHHLVKCSNCRAILMDVWVTSPENDNAWKIKANCPFCYDSSFPLEIKGLFHYGGYGKIKKDDDTDDVPSTKIENIDIENETFIFKVVKANDNAKPIK